MNNIFKFKKLNYIFLKLQIHLINIMLENFSIFNILDTSYKNNKTIDIEIYNTKEFDKLKFDLIKILYYNKISYNIKSFNNKVVLTLN